MRALKITAEGSVTSFRYPHFVQGVHLTFEMPPPATIYGHICSVVGEWIPPDITDFAYHFAYDAKFFDYEHLHFFGKEAKMNPFRRELLFNPRLTLYVSNVSLLDYFRRPRYAVALGRTQDLMTYVDVREVELYPASQAFYEGTLLTLEDAAEIGGPSFAVTMPRFIDEQRVPTWEQYAVLEDRMEYPSATTLAFQPREIWVDPEPDARHPYLELQRSVVWHSWI